MRGVVSRAFSSAFVGASMGSPPSVTNAVMESIRNRMVRAIDIIAFFLSEPMVYHPNIPHMVWCRIEITLLLLYIY